MGAKVVSTELESLHQLSGQITESVEFTATELAQCAGITLRTLHHYDAIGLLPPAIRLSNGRRLYHSEQVLRLCQILWMKGCGLPLKRIQVLLKASATNTEGTLRKQRSSLQLEIKRLQQLEQSLGKALSSLRGIPMSKEELAAVVSQAAPPSFDFNQWAKESFGDEFVTQSQQRAAQLPGGALMDSMQKSLTWMQEMCAAAAAGLEPGSEAVQTLLAKSLEIAPTLPEDKVLDAGVQKAHYLKARELYAPDSALRASLEQAYPGFPDLFWEASAIFAANRWPD